MSGRTIKRPCLDSRVITVDQWNDQLANLDELVRPVILRLNEAHGLVTIRPKRADEIAKIKERRGLATDACQLETYSGSLADAAPEMRLIQETT